MAGRLGAGLSAIGHALGAGYIVTGSVQRSGSRLRVTADAGAGHQRRSRMGRQYERGDGDLFAIMTDIAQRGGGNRGQYDEERSLRARPTESRDA